MIAEAYPTETVEELDRSICEYEYMEPTQDRLLELMKELFEAHWSSIVFGPCIQGAVFEIQLSEPPRGVGFLDGYLTVDVGPWHFHLCLGTHKGSKTNPTPEALARIRRPAKAAFFKSIGPRKSFGSWGFRMWNGASEQMLTVFLPNPYLSDRMKPQKPDWSRLSLWNGLRKKYLPGATEWSPRGMMHDEEWEGH